MHTIALILSGLWSVRFPLIIVIALWGWASAWVWMRDSRDACLERDANLADHLRRLSDNKGVLWTVARRAVEDELVEWRDAGRFTIRNNGFTIRWSDGSPNDIIRFGPEVGIRIALRALADYYDPTKPPRKATPPEAPAAPLPDDVGGYLADRMPPWMETDELGLPVQRDGSDH